MSDLSPDDQARIFYLSFLGIALLGGVIYQYRDRIGTALQHLAIWALLICGLVLVYGFRDELAGQFNIGRPVEVDAQSVRLHRGADGHFHARLAVNGVEVAFLVDTGATEIVLSPEDARRVGFDPNRLAYTQLTETANGMVRAARIVLDEMQLGPLYDRNIPALVNEVPLPYSLLGMRYLDRFSSLTIEGGRLTLSR
ncbi:MAG: TIGR02281 family clan AA aspartic protease [Pseudomonadota bacterium]